MAELGESCCVPAAMAVQLTKPDKNNNTTANVDDGIALPSEQCDVTEDGTDEKSESTGDSDERRLSSGADDDGINNTTNATEITTIASSSSSNAGTELPIQHETSTNNTSTSTNHVSTTDPYKDFSGVDTESFIATTLRNNPKDRTLLLQLELLLQQFIQDAEQTSHQFQAMNSYERMIVHRVAAFFGLDHNVDKNGQAVVVTKTANTRIPHFSFQKCIPEDEPTDITSGASTSDNPLSLTNPSEIPARRILRRHEKNPNHEHSHRNGLNDDYTNAQISGNTKAQPLSKPYLERVNNYAETRARIFNDTSEPSNTSMANKNAKSNQKQHSTFTRPPYRKQQQQQQQHQNSSHQHRSYSYQHSQQTNNNHMQQYPTGKALDLSSHMLNNSTTRTPSMYPAQQPPSANLSMPQGPIYASMIASNPNAGSLRPPAGASFYPSSQQPPVDYDYKHQTGGAHMYNYVPMIPSTASNFLQQQTQALHPQQPPTAGTAGGPNQLPSQHGAGMPLPILVHQQATGQIQYIFPAHALQQHQQQQPPLPANSYPITPDGQYVQLYRPDTLSMPTGPPTVPPSSIVDSNNHHHHQFSQNQPYHHHQLSQQQQQQQQQSQQSQQIPSSQSNPAPQPPPFVRIYPTGPPGNVSHSFAQATYQPPPPTTFVQPGTIAGPSFIIPPPQTASGVQTYSTFDNNIPYNTYGPAPTTTGKTNANNNGASIQYTTNHLSALNLQSHHDEYQPRYINNQPTRFSHSNGSTVNNPPRNFMGRPLVQSPKGAAGTPRMAVYSTSNQHYRPSRPFHNSTTDKQLTSNENDPKALISAQQQQQQTNSDNASLAGPAQE